MARRTSTPLSAGAAALLGLGAIGFAAGPAQAATVTQQYECTYTVLNVGEVAGDPAVSVELTVDLPETAESGDTLTADVTAKVTIPDSRRDSLYGLLGVRAVDAPDAATAAAEDGGLNPASARNKSEFVLSMDGQSVAGAVGLSAPVTVVPDSGPLVVTATGSIDDIVVGEAGTYTFSAGDFQGYIRGYENANGTGYKTNITLDCTNVSTDKTITTVTVTEGSGTETSSGTGTSSGTETSSGTGTSSSSSSSTSASTTTASETTPMPTTTSGPETPGTVQTDGADKGGRTDAAALGLGSLLAVGAAAGSVVVLRRRGAAQH